jgi:hypothetical protein
LIPRIEKNPLELRRLSRLYAARAGAHPALASFPRLDLLLSALAGPEQAEPETRRRLVCAVLAEHQASPGPLGIAVLLHAFRGMLVGLSRSLVGVDSADDADGLVVTGFIEALKRVRPERDPDRIGMYVRQETRRAVFAVLRRDARAQECFEAEEEAAPTVAADRTGDPDAPDATPDDADERGDDASVDEAEWDPLALERAWRRRGPETVADDESLTPLEDRMFFLAPTVDGIPEDTLLRAHAVRGGLRRLTEHLFEDASHDERRRLFRRIVQRAERLRAARTRAPSESRRREE